MIRISNTLPHDYKKTTKSEESFTPEDIQKDVTKLSVFAGQLADLQGRVVKVFPALIQP